MVRGHQLGQIGARLDGRVPNAGVAAFLARPAVRRAKRESKDRFAGWLKSATGVSVDPDTIFDTQIKRIHEYKRQLLNALRIIVLYNRLRANPGQETPPRTIGLSETYSLSS